MRLDVAVEAEGVEDEVVVADEETTVRKVVQLL